LTTTDLLAKKILGLSHLTGEFTLRSGEISHQYFDKYQFESEPAVLHEICENLLPLLPQAEFLAGIEMGGIPIATVLSQMTQQPTLFVRKEAKKYGTAKLAEGPEFTGRHILLVEDIVTSGGQIALSANELRELGATVTHAVCVIDREAGGKENLAKNGIELISLYLGSDIEGSDIEGSDSKDSDLKGSE
jgi:orotate phosphoribosyltransferase